MLCMHLGGPVAEEAIRAQGARGRAGETPWAQMVPSKCTIMSHNGCPAPWGLKACPRLGRAPTPQPETFQGYRSQPMPNCHRGDPTSDFGSVLDASNEAIPTMNCEVQEEANGSGGSEDAKVIVKLSVGVPPASGGGEWHGPFAMVGAHGSS